MLEELKQKVYLANMELVNKQIVLYTWGNVSGIQREQGLVVIKPSGLRYDLMSPDDMVVVDLWSGEVVEGKWKPSSDTKTHLELYRKYESIGGITHTHSINAVAFAQAGRPIPVLGTTHADDFYGDIPCTRSISESETNSDYEMNTGKVIVETIEKNGKDVMSIPGVLVRNHGPFTWGNSPEQSVYHAIVLEALSEMAIKTLLLNPDAIIPQHILDKHYMRKHGEHAYYGQDKY